MPPVVVKQNELQLDEKESCVDEGEQQKQVQKQGHVRQSGPVQNQGPEGPMQNQRPVQNQGHEQVQNQGQKQEQSEGEERDGEEPEEFTVFVTGFGPFPNGRGGHHDTNASHEITRLLPSHLPSSHPLNPTPYTIKILNPTAPTNSHILVEYAFIRSYIATLHSRTPPPPPHSPGAAAALSHRPARTPDLYLHIGMAAGWDYVSVERRAYAQGFSSSWWSRRERQGYYMIPDDADCTVKDAGSAPWDGEVPVGLETGVDVDAVVAGAGRALSALDTSEEALAEGGSKGRKFVPVRPHDEPGPYCCGFIYYESLAGLEMAKRGQEGGPKVLFCHVPGETDARSLDGARDAVVAVIGATVGVLAEQRGRGLGAEDGERLGEVL